MPFRQYKFVIGSKTEVVKADEDIERTKVAADVPNLTLIVHLE